MLLSFHFLFVVLLFLVFKKSTNKSQDEKKISHAHQSLRVQLLSDSI